MKIELFGLVEMFYVTARIVQHFEAISLPDDSGSPIKKLGAGVMLPPDGALVQFRVAGGL